MPNQHTETKIDLYKNLIIKERLNNPELSIREFSKRLKNKYKQFQNKSVHTIRLYVTDLECEDEKLKNMRVRRSLGIEKNVTDAEAKYSLLKDQIRKKIKRASTITDIANTFDVSPKRVKDVLAELKAENYNIHLKDDAAELVTEVKVGGSHKIDLRLFENKSYKIGFVTDAHLCNKGERLDVLNAIFDRYAEEGITDVYDGGNWIDGEFKYNKFDLHTFGMDNQLKYLIENYPQRKGIKIKYIAGDDHEGWYQQREGIIIGKHLELMAREAGRNDLEYCGYMEADFELKASKGSAILRVVHAGGGSSYALCFDKATEILTENGWKYFKDINKEEKVATLSDDDFFEWQKPTAYTDEHYSGEMLHFSARSFDLMVTPNHRMWTRRYIYKSNRKNKKLNYPQKARKQLDYSWGLVEAQKMIGFRKQSWQMQRGGVNWEGENLHEVVIPERKPKKYASTKIKHLGKLKIEDVAELIAWYVTEGSTHNNGKSVTISQSLKVNPDNHYAIRDLFNRIGLHFNARGRDSKDIDVSSVELVEWLNSVCGKGSRNKYLPKWLKESRKDILEIVFETMIRGDGWVSDRGFGYKSISKRLREDLAEIAIKLGYGVTLYKDTVSITSVQIYPTINNEPEKIKYNDRIYCVTVPNARILVRRNGKVIWSGNSYQPQKLIESLTGGDKPHILCFVPDSQITMQNGEVKNIQDVKVDDIVITHTGTKQKVNKTFVRNFQGKIKNIWAYGIPSNTIKCSGEHPFFINRGGVKQWMQAEELNAKTDWIGRPILQEESSHVIDIIDYLTTSFYRLNADKNSIVARNGKIYPRFIKVDEDFAHLLGLYVAEGYVVGKHRVCFAFNQEEKEYTEFVQKQFNKYFQCEGSVVDRSNSKSRVVRFNDPIAPDLFINLIGRGAANKRLPEWSLALPKNIQNFLVRGIFEGDGCKSEYYFELSTVSKLLVEQVLLITARIGLGAGYSAQTRRGGRSKTAYTIRVYHNADLGEKWFDKVIINQTSRKRLIINDGKYVWHKLKQVQEEPYNGELFNFEVEHDNSYLVSSLIAHNCIGHYHKAEVLPSYRNVRAVQGGCVCDQTRFMRKKRLEAHVGGWIIEFQQAKDGSINRFKTEWLGFFDQDFYRARKYYV